MVATTAVRQSRRHSRLLVLEPQPILRDIQTLMKDEGVSIEPVPDLRRALEVVNSSGGIDAAILDLDGEEGIRTGTYFRRAGQGRVVPEMPYIFTTCDDNTIRSRALANELNAWGFHQIPRELPDLSATITNALRKQRTLFSKGKVLVVGGQGLSLSRFLKHQGFDADLTPDAYTAVDLLEKTPPDSMVITDHNLTGKMNGLELLRFVRDRWPSIFVAYMGMGDEKNVVLRYLQAKIDDILPNQPGPEDLDSFYQKMRLASGQEGLFQRVFNNGEPAHIATGDGIISYSNKGSDKLFGIKVDGYNLADLVTDPEVLLRSLIRTNPSTFTTKAVTPTGKEIPVSVELRPLQDGQQFSIIYRRVEEGISAFGTPSVYRPADLLAAGVAHDINSLVSVMAGYAEDIHMDITTAPERITEDSTNTKLLKIMAAGTSCRYLLNGYKNWTRNGSAWAGPLQVESLLADLESLAQPLYRNKKAALKLNLQPCPPVNGDYSAFQSIFINLIKNAAEAIGDAPGEITVANRSEGDNVYISVTDTGPGITREHQGRIFTQLFTTKKKGTGLGLYNSRELAKRFGGTLELDVDYFPGARFVLQFPVCKEVPKESPSTPDS